MFTAESTVGILVEFRFIGSPTLEQAQQFRADAGALVKRTVKHGGKPAVLCTDLRACGLLKPDASDIILGLMRADTPHVVRNAFLGNDTAVLSLQIQRMIVESGDRGLRKLFMKEALLVSWLSEVTDAAEQTRLKAFLGSGRGRR